jgi:ABC-2 type transport system ATP-binding protein
MNLLRVTDLAYSFGRCKIIDDVNLTISSNSITLLLGSNGSGKSTLLRLIAGILKPQKGMVIHNSSIYYVGHRSQLYLAGENGSTVKHVVDKLGLSSYLFKTVGDLSQGMLQKVSIAKALFYKPNLLLLDEPTASLDNNSVQTLKLVLRSGLKEGLFSALLIATHDESRLTDCSDKHIHLELGKIVEETQV